VAADPAGVTEVVEGLDVIRADASHPVQRTLGGLPAMGASEVSVSAKTSAGLGKPLIVKIQK
jgi:hypothetical protein